MNFHGDVNLAALCQLRTRGAGGGTPAHAAKRRADAHPASETAPAAGGEMRTLRTSIGIFGFAHSTSNLGKPFWSIVNFMYIRHDPELGVRMLGVNGGDEAS